MRGLEEGSAVGLQGGMGTNGQDVRITKHTMFRLKMSTNTAEFYQFCMYFIKSNEQSIDFYHDRITLQSVVRH